MQRVLRAFGLEAQLASADVVEAWPAVAREVLGADAAVTSAIRIESDTLVVAVPSAQWSSEIRLRERALVERLRARVPRASLSRIRSVPASARGPGQVS